MTPRIPLRRLEQERLAAQIARERRRRTMRKLKWLIVFLLLGAIVAAVTYAVFFMPYTSLREMLPVPRKLIAVVFNVNGSSQTVPADGTLVLHPADLVEVEDINTDGRFNWGLHLSSPDFSANQLLEGRRRIGDFWQDYDYLQPKKVVLRVEAGSHVIGNVQLVIRLRARDWVQKAEAAVGINEKVKYYERAAQLSPDNVLILTNLARLYGEQGQWAKAAAAYEKVAATSSTIPIMRSLVEAYQQAGKTDKALDGYVKLMKMAASDKESFYGFISYLNAKKSPRQASRYLAAKIRSLPSSFRAEAYAYLGTLYGQANDWKHAVKAYEKALAAGASNPVILVNLSEAYSRTGNPARAEEKLKAYLKKKPKDLDAKFRLVEVYRQRKKYRAAARLLKEIIKDRPKNLKAHMLLVEAYNKLHMNKEAAREYEAIARLAPKNKVVYYNQGTLFFGMKQYDKAANAFKEAIKLDSKDVDSREYLYRIYIAQKKTRKAVEVLEELIKLKPSHWDYYSQAFALYDELKDYKAMSKTMSEAVKRAPKKAQLRGYLAVSYEKRGLLADAARQFAKAAALAPKNKSYLSHLANLYERLGKVDDALKTYEKILELDPDNTEAQESYLRLKLKKLQSQAE